MADPLQDQIDAQYAARKASEDDIATGRALLAAHPELLSQVSSEQSAALKTQQAEQHRVSEAAGQSVENLDTAIKVLDPLAKVLTTTGALGLSGTALLGVGVPAVAATLGAPLLYKIQQLGGDAAKALGQKVYGNEHPIADMLAQLAGSTVAGGAALGPLASANAKINPPIMGKGSILDSSGKPMEASSNVPPPPSEPVTPESAATTLAQKQIEALKTARVGEGVATEFGKPEIATTVPEAQTIAEGQALRAALEPPTGIAAPKMAAQTAAIATTYSDEAAALGTQAREILTRANAGEDVTASLKELTNRYSAFAVNYANVAGARSDVARGLQILDPLKPGNAYATATAKLAQQLDAEGNPQQLAEALANLSPQGATRMARQIAETAESGGSLYDGLVEYYKANLLTNPRTFARNFLGNSITALGEIPTRAVASRLPGATVQPGEASAMIRGITDGFWDAVRYGQLSFRNNRPEYDISGGVQFVEKPAAITAANVGVDPESAIGRAIDFLGNIVRLPFRGLTAADQYQKAINGSMEQHALAWRQAVSDAASEGLAGPPAYARAAQLYSDTLKDMPTSIIEASKDFSALTTFTNAIEGKLPQAMKTIANEPGMNLVLPFFKTPYNIFRYGLDYSPFGVATQWGALKAGGAAGDIAKAKIAMGSTLAGITAYEALQGNVTGDGPRNPAALEALRRTGWQPNSMRVGDHWVSIPEPYRQPITLVANAVELMHELDEPNASQVATAVVLATARSFSNASFVQGLANMREAISEAADKGIGQAGERFVSRTLQGFVPAASLLAGVTRAEDPTIRQTQGIIDQMKSRIPGYSKDLPPRRDIFGDPVMGMPGVPENLLYPVDVTKIKPDALDQEIINAQPTFARVPQVISGRSPKVLDNPNDPDIGVVLTPQERDQWAIFRGEGLKDQLMRLINSDGYKGSSTLMKRQLLEFIGAKYSEVATAKLLRSSPDLMARYIDRQRLKGTALLPPDVLTPPVAAPDETSSTTP